MSVRAADPNKLIAGANGDWEVVVGMEIHAQVSSKAKLFSGASTAFGGAPNAHVSLVDAAMPGMLPVINQACIAQAVRTGLGLEARINLKSRFDRKNYFYPDLPQGYQISQYQQPLVGEGTVSVDLDGGETIGVGIERLHLEQDAGKSLHDRHATMSLVDLNRSGVALMEIVSKPDIRSAEEAKAFLAKLRAILRYLGTCDGDMEKGHLRADVNISVRRPGEPLGTRTEVKNLNSVRFIGQAIDHEARRQIAVIEDGGVVDQETRLFDPARGVTRPMRTKEEAHDYRYFPDPDLLPLELEQAWVDALAADLPELPDAKRERFLRLGLMRHDVERLIADGGVADFFEATLAELERIVPGCPSVQLPFEACKWVSGTLLGALRSSGLTIDQSRVSPEQLARVISLIYDPEFGRQLASRAFMLTWDEGGDPRNLLESRGLKQVTDTVTIEAMVDEVIAAHPDRVEQVKAKPAALGWFVGQVMKASGGKADPKAVNALLKAKLGLQVR